jgi:hypothetical protein
MGDPQSDSRLSPGLHGYVPCSRAVLAQSKRYDLQLLKGADFCRLCSYCIERKKACQTGVLFVP